MTLIFSLTGGARIAFGQDQATLGRPVTALYADGDRLLIGQGSTLVEAQITADDLVLKRSTDLGRHDIRGITVKDSITLVLSEDGLTSLNANGSIIDFAQGGGQQVAVKFGRVYIAAREAGVRILKIDVGGKLTPLGILETLGPAVDLAPEGDSWLWVAEEKSGVRLYDAANPNTPRMLLWLGDLAPATAVRVNGPRLLIGYGNTLSLVDTINVQSPHLLSSAEIGGPDTEIGDILIQGNRVYVGRTAPDAPDAVAVDISTPKAIQVAMRVGDNGSGEHMALFQSDLFLGSAKIGLRRFQIAGGNTSLKTAWTSTDVSTPCTMSLPANPQPPNLGEIASGPVTLTWTAGCGAARYEIDINGVLAGETQTSRYTFTPNRGIVLWQVIAIDGSGKRLDGPQWSFESVQEGWLATPIPISTSTTLYKPEATPIMLRTPGAVLAATCAALCLGALVIAGGAWAIGTLAERRALRRGL